MMAAGRVTMEALRGLLRPIEDFKERQFELFGLTAPRVTAEIIEIPPAEPEIASLLSPSRLRSFLDCSGRWWYHYGLGLPDIQNANLALGKSVHAALGENFAQKIETKQDLATTGVVALFRNSWQEQAGETTFDADDNFEALQATGETLVAKYMDEVAPRVEPAAVELPVTGRIGGVAVRGYVDVLDVHGKIIDLKTASRKPSGIDPLYRSQAATYAQITPGASGEISVHTLIKTRAPQIVEQSFTRTPGDVKWIETIYPHAQAAMRRGFYTPNRASMFCSRGSCAFWERCEADFGGQVKL
jgi:hypothetical protein